MSFELQSGDRVVVTGAAGFIGSAVTRALLRRGVQVIALTEPGADVTNLRDLDVEQREVDITNKDQLNDVFDGARFCFHLAAKFDFWAKDPSSFYAVNVDGTRNVVGGAVAAGVERVVYTSTVGVVGLGTTKTGRAANEDDAADITHLHGSYKQTKYVAEHEVLRMAAEGAPVVLVLPTMPHGPYDHRPTPSGKVVLDFLNGRMPGYVDTAMNVAHVDDLAEGHLLALERGRQGRSYICGGENLTMAQLLATLVRVTGIGATPRRFPSAFPVIAGAASQFVEGTVLRRRPHVPLEAAQMAATKMTFDDSRAREELHYVSRPASEALYDSARWFVEHGYVSEKRKALIHWNPPSERSQD